MQLMTALHFDGAEEMMENPYLYQQMVPPLLNDVAMLVLYQSTPQPPLSSPIVYFEGEHDPIVGPSAIKWQLQTSGGFKKFSLNGGHYLFTTHAHEVSTLVKVKQT